MKKQVKLCQLVLTNYRNIEYATYNFDGDTKIIGENRIGKTNTLEAIYWLLTDYLLGGSADIARIKPLDDTKKEVVVKATFDIDGEPFILKKCFKETWKKPRGSSELVMSGHSTEYYINETKQPTKKDYENLLNESLGLNGITFKTPIDIKRLLIDPTYLCEIGETKDWSNLRSFIIELVGDVDDNDVINHEPTLEPIRELLHSKGGKLDQAKKYQGQLIKEIREQVFACDAQLKGYAQVARPTDEAIALARKGIEEHETNIARLRASNGIDTQSQIIEKQLTEIRNNVVKVREKILTAPNPIKEQEKKINDEILSKNTEIQNVINERNKYVFKGYELDNSKTQLTKGIENEKNTQINLIAKIRKIDSDKKSIADSVPTECPYCHKPYDQSEIANRTKELVETLDHERNDLIAQGKASKAKMLEMQDQLNSINATIKEHATYISGYEAEIDDLNNDITKLKLQIEQLNNDQPIGNTPLQNELNSYCTQRDELEAKLEKSKQEFSLGMQNVNAQIVDEQEAMKPFKSVLADLDYYERTQADIAKVNANKNVYERKLARAEQDFELLAEFVRIKLEMLDNNVSSVFGNIKFQLIKENINGGYDPTCKPYIYDVDKQESTLTLWSSASKSERVITGIAVVEAIKAVKDMPNLPYLFDEGGEISNDTLNTKLKTNSQLICVKVADGIMTPTTMPIK